MTVTSQSGVDLRVRHWSEWPQVAQTWSNLVDSSERPSFFVTKAWIGAWLTTFGPVLEPSLLIVERDEEPVAACILSRATPTLVRVPVRSITLNAAGEPAEDTVYSEYNSLVARPGCESLLASALAGHSASWKWDEIRLDGFTPGPGYEALKNAFEGLELREQRRASHYVDLAAIRASGSPFEAVLSGTSRKHLRQNVRYHGEIGKLAIEPAASVDQASAMFDELADLGRRRWSNQGQRCVFDSPRFLAFHRLLIATAFPAGGTQLLRVTAGGETVGVVYNLVHQGRVYFYQCGYNYTSDKRLSPGTVSLSMAIDHCLEQGFDEYDFLSGHGNYKRGLSTGSRELVWAAFRATGVKMRVLGGLQQLRQRLQGGEGPLAV